MARIIPIPIGPIYTGGPCRGIVHVIEKGDTLYQLGKRYHVSVGQLMFANPFVNVYNLQIGDELCIPVSIQPRNQEEMTPGEMQQREMQQRGMTPGEMQQWEMQQRGMTPGEMQQWEMQQRGMTPGEMMSEEVKEEVQEEVKEEVQEPEEIFQEETEEDFNR